MIFSKILFEVNSLPTTLSISQAFQRNPSLISQSFYTYHNESARQAFQRNTHLINQAQAMGRYYQ